MGAPPEKNTGPQLFFRDPISIDSLFKIPFEGRFKGLSQDNLLTKNPFVTEDLHEV